MSDSTQHKLDKNRTPRVHITYDVHRDGATIKRELPFVVGVMADLSGHRATPLPRLKDRQFLEIDGDTFDGVLADAAPRLELRVENALEPGADTLGVVLEFTKLDDFAPDQVARQVKELRELLDERDMLADVVNRIESTPRFGDALQDILGDKERRGRFSDEVDAALQRSEPEKSE